MASAIPHRTSSQFARALLLRYCLLFSLLLCSAMAPLSKAKAGGEKFLVDVQVLDKESPVPGVIVSIDYFHVVTDKDGRAIFDLFAGAYDLHISRTKGATPVIKKIEIGPDKTIFQVDLNRFEQILTIDPNQPQGLALGTFGDFNALARFWNEYAVLAEEQLGNVRAVLDRSGNFAVLAGPPELQDAAELERSLDEARTLGFSSSFPLAREFVVSVLSDGTDLAFPTVEERLLAVLRDDDAEVRRGARTALGALGPPAVPGLLAALTGGDYRTDLGALVALSWIDGWRAEPDELSRVWNAASPYGDRLIDTAVRDALRAMHADAKLAYLGFTPGRKGVVDFQESNRLVPDGVITDYTSRALNDQVFATLVKTQAPAVEKAIYVRQLAKEVASPDPTDKRRWVKLSFSIFINEAAGVSATEVMSRIEKVVYKFNPRWYKPSAYTRFNREDGFSKSMRVWGQTKVSVDIYVRGLDKIVERNGYMNLYRTICFTGDSSNTKCK